MRLALIAALLFATGSEAAERRYATDDEAARWRSVGLLDIAGQGRCTGALIRPDVVLTAAHCVADAGAKTVAAASDVRFIAGRRGPDNAGVATAAAIEVHPGYFATGATYTERQVRTDVAKIILNRPLPGLEAFRVDYTPPVGADVALLSYSENRQKRLSIQSPCKLADRKTEFLLLDCLSNPGASGAPYFSIASDGTTRLVGVNSGRRGRGGQSQALALALDHLRDFIGPTGGLAGGSAQAPSAPSISRSRTTRLPGASVPGDGLKRISRP